jgi:chemotaxis response regulator CheB
MRPTRILVIEDSLTMRALLEAVLGRGENIEIVGLSQNAAEARECLGERQPDIVTLDLGLPDADGLELLDELTRRSNAAVLVVSGATKQGSPVAKEAMKRGAIACFDKARLVQQSAAFLRTIGKTMDRRQEALAA